MCIRHMNVQAVAASRVGGMGAFSPQLEALHPHLPPSQKKQNGQSQPFLAFFFIFVPSELHFAPSMPPPQYWCRHCVQVILNINFA